MSFLNKFELYKIVEHYIFSDYGGWFLPGIGDPDTNRRAHILYARNGHAASGPPYD